MCYVESKGEKIMTTRKPTHPGAFLKWSILKERGISVTDAARFLGITRQALYNFTNERYRCSNAMARRLAE